MLTGTCHCESVRIEVPRKPAALTSCNCSICRRYGALWAYYKASSVRVDADRRALATYSWGDKRLAFVRCGNCGCVMQWKKIGGGPDSRMGVNFRNFDAGLLTAIRIRHLDGAATWKFLD